MLLTFYIKMSIIIYVIYIYKKPIWKIARDLGFLSIFENKDSIKMKKIGEFL